MLKFKKLFGTKTQNSESEKKVALEANISEQGEKGSLDQSDEMPSLNEDQVSISTTGVSPADGALLVGFFLSNGLSNKVKFDKIPLVLLDSEKRVLARQSFDGDSIGEIAGGSSKACVVRFDQSNVYVKEVPVECSVCFDLPAKQPDSIQFNYQSLPANITEAQQQELERVLAELPPMKHGELNLSPLRAQVTDQSELLTTVIIRNATAKGVHLQRISFVAFDAQRTELARGLFDIDNLTIEPFKAIIWTFNFGPISEDQVHDLSNWYLDVVR